MSFLIYLVNSEYFKEEPAITLGGCFIKRQTKCVQLVILEYGQNVQICSQFSSFSLQIPRNIHGMNSLIGARTMLGVPPTYTVLVRLK